MEHITKDSQIIYYSGSDNAIQTTLDFDYACEKDKPSLVGIVKPGKHGVQTHFWGDQPMLLPVYPSIENAFTHHPDVIAVVNFASKRNAPHATEAIIAIPAIRYQVIIAEGIAERDVRIIRQKARDAYHTIFGPSIFGIIIAGTIQLGPAGGGVELQARAGLHRPGHVAVVTKSGGLVNEFAHIVAQASGSVHSIIAVGGDRYPCTSLLEVLLMLEHDPQVKLIVLQGEVGGKQEIAIAEKIQEGTLTKPIVAYTTGIAADSFPKEFQFGHAGAQAVKDDESAIRKNLLLRESGANVPERFEQLGESIERESARFHIPKNKAYELNTTLFQSRKKPNIVSTITDDRGGIPMYNTNSALDLATQTETSIARVIGHLWFKKNIPTVMEDFISILLKLTADHGPNVAGAHNTIVATRAGKDLVSSLASGLLTIGPRFGGASGSAAKIWYHGVRDGISSRELVDMMNNKHAPIPGIGHRTKSKFNPDQRVTTLQEFAEKRLKKTVYLNYARAVEAITLSKNHSLILNIDGMIGAVALDVFTEAGSTPEELENYLTYDILDGLFVLSRSIGLIGHYIDQKRLDAPLYRHDPNDTFIAV